jgi:hypothetical protein
MAPAAINAGFTMKVAIYFRRHDASLKKIQRREFLKIASAARAETLIWTYTHLNKHQFCE